MAYAETTHEYCLNNAEFRTDTRDEGGGLELFDVKVEIAGDGPAQTLASGRAVAPLAVRHEGSDGSTLLVTSQAVVLGPLPIGGLTAGGDALRLAPGTGLAGKLFRGGADPENGPVGDLADQIGEDAPGKGFQVWGFFAFTSGSTALTPGGLVAPPDGTVMTGKTGRVCRLPVYVDRQA